MKYAITTSPDPTSEEVEVVDGKDNMEARVMEFYTDGYIDDDEEVYVYPLGKRIVYSMERKLVGKER